MYKILNILMITLIIIFIFSIYKHYSSNKTINTKEYSRSNINEILKEKIPNLPVLNNDTNNVIEFNNSIEGETDEKKKRSFWELLKKNEN